MNYDSRKGLNNRITGQIRNGKQPLRIKAAEDSLFQLLYIIHTVEKAYILRFMKLATRKIVDEHVLSKVYLVVITKLAEMRKTVYQALSSFLVYNCWFGSFLWFDIRIIASHLKNFTIRILYKCKSLSTYGKDLRLLVFDNCLKN
jgi:hypothetical protein